MSARNKLDEYIYLALLTEPRNIGESTKRSPQHLTLVPPFAYDVKLADLKDAVRDVAADTEPFWIEVEGEAKFGPSRNIDVRLIKPAGAVRRLHSLLMYRLEAVGVNLPTKYVFKGFVPHITIKPAHLNQLQQGDRFLLDHIAIMQKSKGSRTLLAREGLKNG